MENEKRVKANPIGLLCRLFGHRPEQGYSGGLTYFQIHPGHVDGIHQEHLRLYTRCRRCENNYVVGLIHGKAASTKDKRIVYIQKSRRDKEPYTSNTCT